MTVFTIGYEGLDIDSFLALLAQHGIGTIVDIRQLPLSRKRGFSKKALAGMLSGAGLEYIHIAGLGCPKPVRDRYREDGDWKRNTRDFLKHLKTQGAALDDLSGRTQSSNCALLCYEADFTLCHRSLVANALQESCELEVRHIRAA
jgi:uncharacterized protein (DUF488 family)